MKISNIVRAKRPKLKLTCVHKGQSTFNQKISINQYFQLSKLLNRRRTNSGKLSRIKFCSFHENDKITYEQIQFHTCDKIDSHSHIL